RTQTRPFLDDRDPFKRQLELVRLETDAGAPDGSHDPTPVCIFPQQRGLHQIRRRDGVGYLPRIGLSPGAGDHHLHAFPHPFPIPPAGTRRPALRLLPATCFVFVSVARIALAASPPPLRLSPFTSVGIPRLRQAIGKGWPITPVDPTNTE